ncbi:MAG: NAD+ synthase [Acidobacteria bacterium]|nr:MAG: NAD+ synthase [Acidobacteriota bacterium]PYY19478.1 MAG: NAD+ synthase [Acidobacteriota bacterium]
MKIALGQINPTVGDFCGNAAKIVEHSHRARAQGADLILFPELAICGYPPRDLVEKPSFVTQNAETLERIAKQTSGIAVICGLVTPAQSDTGKSVMNSAALVRDGRVEFMQSKMLLPTYDVFDEDRYFAPARKQEVVSLDGSKLALTICEDAWNDKHFWHKRLYSVDPVEELVRAGGNLVLNISASPFTIHKRETRKKMLQAIAADFRVPVVMCNQVGGNDSLIFDGSSIVIGPDGRVLAQAKSFEEDLVLFDTETLKGDLHDQPADTESEAYAALVLGTRDYVCKCGFKKVIVGLSGGIDSALTAAIAVDALGTENVMGVSMPGPYSSQGSKDDARELATNLGIRYEVIPISPVFDEFRKALSPAFRSLPEDFTEENIQSRLRGSTLMALSNKLGALVLTTGNKSEMAVGYCTLYGDMCGGLAVIADVPKTMVYHLSEYRNRISRVIPDATIKKVPSAELRPNQTDQDSLPPYEVLDCILEDYVEDYKTAEQICSERGYDCKLVKSVIRMIERSEYKRQQAAPILKISQKAFGLGRRFPIAAKYEAQC